MPDRCSPLVLITNAVPGKVLAPLDGLARLVMGPDDGGLMSRDEVLRRASDLVGIINQGELRVDRELLEAAPQLRIVANVAIGSDNLDLDLMTAAGVYATNVPSGFVESLGDFTLGLLLAPYCSLSPVALAASLQIDAACPNCLIQEHVTLGETLLKEPFVTEAGFLEVPERSVPGIEIDEVKLVAEGFDGVLNNPRFTAEDGGFAEW